MATINDLIRRYDKHQQAIRKRLNAMGIQTYREGRNSIVPDSYLPLLDELDAFLKANSSNTIKEFLQERGMVVPTVVEDGEEDSSAMEELPTAPTLPEAPMAKFLGAVADELGALRQDLRETGLVHVSVPPLQLEHAYQPKPVSYLERVQMLREAAETGVPLHRQELLQILKIRRAPARITIGCYEITRTARDWYSVTEIIKPLPDLVPPPTRQ